MQPDHDLTETEHWRNLPQQALADPQHSSTPTRSERAKASLAEGLRRRVAVGKGPSKVGRLRKWFDLLEAAHSDGVSNADLISELESQGLALTLHTYESLMSRIRRERRCATDKMATRRSLGPPPVSARAPPVPSSGATTAYRPADIRRIIESSSNLDEYD